MQGRIVIRPRFWGFVIIAMILCFSASCAVGLLRSGQAARHLSALMDEKQRLTEDIAHLTEQLNYVRTDAYIERVARDELNMIMPGEIRYVSN